MPNKTPKESYIENEKKEYTVKVTSIVKVLVIIVLLGLSFVAGWTQRSNFANEVKSEVRTQMSAMTLKDNQ